MNPHSNPLDYLIQCCDDAANTGHWTLDKFTILNAKNELQKLRQKLADSYQELFNCNQDLVEEINKPLDYTQIGWARINNRGDLYNLSICHNPYLNEDTLLPIYSNEKEYKEKYGNLSK